MQRGLRSKQSRVEVLYNTPQRGVGLAEMTREMGKASSHNILFCRYCLECPSSHRDFVCVKEQVHFLTAFPQSMLLFFFSTVLVLFFHIYTSLHLARPAFNPPHNYLAVHMAYSILLSFPGTSCDPHHILTKRGGNEV